MPKYILRTIHFIEVQQSGSTACRVERAQTILDILLAAFVVVILTIRALLMANCSFSDFESKVHTSAKMSSNRPCKVCPCTS